MHRYFVFVCLVLWGILGVSEAFAEVSAGGTDRGVMREQNEDSYVILSDARLYVVADGMGGHAAGEVASAMAVESMERAVRNPLWDALSAVWPSANTVLTAVGYHAANAAILRESLSNPARRGMGTTMVSAVVLPGDVVEFVNVGDSRAYFLHEHGIRQVTKDQSLVQQLIDEGKLRTPEEIARFPYKNIITQALGTQREIVPVVTREHVVPGDIVLLCSDGLTNELTDAQILEIVESSESLEAAVTTLIARANAAGGHDNITVVLVRF